MATSWDRDEQLLADLDAALRVASEMPARLIEVGKEAFAWRRIDAELAELSHDSATAPELAGTRAERTNFRTMTFVASQLTIELEVVPEGLVGQVVPAQSGEIELHLQDGEARAATVDHVGWFAFRPAPVGMFRLHVQTATGGAALTEWARL